jgi:predicted permease
MTEDAHQAPVHRLTDVSPSRAVLKFGLYTGFAMIAEMAIALIVINRVPGLERYAVERNAFFSGCFLILMLVPICRFLRAPVRMFSSAMIAWAIFALGYDLAGLYFDRLFEALHHGPFLVLVEGAVLYGVCAVGAWVAEMIVHACRYSIAPDRRAARAAAARNAR